MENTDVPRETVSPIPKNNSALGDKKPKNKGGRPSKFGDIDIEKVKKLAGAGLTDEQMQVALEIANDTFYKWKLHFPQFSEALKAKELPDGTIERSLWERAKGYTHASEEVHINAQGKVTRVPILKHYPPDPTSMIFWLKNRQQKRWRDQVDNVHSGTVNQVVKYHKPERKKT